MTNQYKLFLDNYFTSLLDLVHTSRRINKILILDSEKYSKSGANYSANSTLVLSDWSGKTDNGWEINFHSGIFRQTLKENYEKEIINILSRQFCLMYFQSYELLEKFFKDCVYFKSQIDKNFNNEIKKIFKIETEITRENIKGGTLLYKGIKKIGKKTLQNLSKKNNPNLRFDELLKILSVVRHSIVHSQSVINKAKINTTEYHYNIFKFLFNYSEINDEQITIELDFQKFEHLIKKLTEFGYQIFKAISIEEKLK